MTSKTPLRRGDFREDLYYRLKVVTLDIPPLRDRREDIAELARFVLRRSATRLKLPAPDLSDEAIRHLEKADWPGNVRELEHVLERALVLSRGGVISESDLAETRRVNAASFDDVPLEEGFHASVERLERRLVERALAASSGNKTRAAELLKINRRLL